MRRRYALLCVITTIVAAGCGSSGSSKVSAATYVKSICSAIAPFEKDVQSRSNALNLSTIKDPVQGKTALRSFLAAVAADTEKVVSQLKAAGTPNVSNGKAISDGIVAAFVQLKAALSRAANTAGSLPTSSAQAFKAAAQALGTSVRGSMSSIGSSLSGLRNQALEKAAATEPSCRALAANA
jgi:hypothetical protein